MGCNVKFFDRWYNPLCAWVNPWTSSAGLVSTVYNDLISKNAQTLLRNRDLEGQGLKLDWNCIWVNIFIWSKNLHTPDNTGTTVLCLHVFWECPAISKFWPKFHVLPVVSDLLFQHEFIFNIVRVSPYFLWFCCWSCCFFNPDKKFSVVVRGTWFDIFISESWIKAVMLTDCDCEIEHTVSVLTQHFLCGKGSPQTELTSRRLFTSADTPPSTPFQPFSSLLFNNPGNLNRCKRVSEPAASTQIEVLSCMVIRPSHENGSVLFLPEPWPPSSSSRQRVVWTPVESTAKISVAPRKGSVSGWQG